MVRMKIALGVTDRRYGERLSEYFAEKQREDVKLSWFRDPKEMKEEKNTGDFEVILAEEEYFLDPKTVRDIPLKILLHEGTAPEELKTLPSIEKYSSVEKILQQVYSLLGEEGPKDRVYLGGKQMIAVYSPAMAEGQIWFSRALAKRLAVKGELLYLCFMDFPGVRANEEDSVSDLSELLYYSRKGETHFMNRLKAAVIRQDGFDTVPCAKNPENLHEFSAEEYEKFFKIMLERSAYRVIIVDFGFLLPGFIRLMRLFSTLYLPMKNTELSRIRQEAFEEYWRKSEKEITVSVMLPECEGSDPAEIVDRMGDLQEIREALREGED